MSVESIRFVVLAFARHQSTLGVLSKIRASAPEALIQVYVDHPKPESGELLRKNRLKLLDGLSALQQSDKMLELVLRERNLGTSLNLLDALEKISNAGDGFVVLEDDCDPSPGFFDFARTVLHSNAHEPNLGFAIFSGANHLFPPFSHLNRSALMTPLSHVWGWGGRTSYLSDLTQFIRRGPTLGDREKIRAFIVGFIPYAPYRNHWNKLLVSNWGELSWDYRLQFWIWARGYQCLIPGANLVRNVGFDSVATNSSSIPDHYQNKLAMRYTMGRIIRPNPKLLIWWELTGYRLFALVRLIRLALSRKGSGK